MKFCMTVGLYISLPDRFFSLMGEVPPGDLPNLKVWAFWPLDREYLENGEVAELHINYSLTSARRVLPKM